MTALSSRSPEVDAWEAAYLRFETPRQEVAKFVARLRRLGVESWDRSLLVLELFCGRGNGLYAWERLGFTRLEGLDISPELLAEYSGPATTKVGDARELPFSDESRDVVAVQGGLHHLHLMSDLDRTLDEIHRVLKPTGRLLIVEPWLTWFLQAAHAACNVSVCRKLSAKVDALATMIELERQTYEDWLRRPEQILRALDCRFKADLLRIQWGKLSMVSGRRQRNSNA